MPQKQSEQVYEFIRFYLASEGYPPSLSELADACKLTQRQVLACLERLARAGRLSFRPERPRGMRLIERPSTEIQTAR